MENKCILVKEKEYDELKGNQQKLIKKYTDEILALKETINELEIKNKELSNLPPVVKINPMRMEVFLKEIHTGYEYSYGSVCKGSVVERYSNHTKTINFRLDDNLHTQIRAIVKLISTKLIAIKEEKESDMKTKLVKLITYEIQQECYTNLAKMSWLDRIDFLRKYKNK